MVNQEHLDILRQGVDTWNRWRQAHPEIRPDFHRADLQGWDLSQVLLNGANLVRADLRDANLSKAVLIEAYLNGAYLLGANLSGANLSRAHLSRTWLTGANMSGAVLYKAILIKARLISVNLTEADFREADLSKAVIGGIYHQADFRGTNLVEPSFGENKWAEQSMTKIFEGAGLILSQFTLFFAVRKCPL